MSSVPKSTTVHMTQMHFTVTAVSSKMMKTNYLRLMKCAIQYSLLITISPSSPYNYAFHSMIMHLSILFLAQVTG